MLLGLFQLFHTNGITEILLKVALNTKAPIYIDIAQVLQ